MSSPAILAATVVVFAVAALLYYQSQEGFSNRSSWTPSQTPIAGRQYDPRMQAYPVPADLSYAPVSEPSGSFPRPPATGGQRPDGVPGAGSLPREALAQIRDLRELDSKITVWLDAASQMEREQPGSMTSDQLQRRVMLQARLADVRDQLGTGLVTDTWTSVADELRELRRENAGWQAQSPSIDAVYGFGQGKDPRAFLTADDYKVFFGYFNAGVLELQGLAQPDPIQKVRLQQLQVIRQDLIDTQRRTGTPPIKMSAAQLFLRQMLKPDQPLPTLFSIEPPLLKTFADSHTDVLADLQDIQWKLIVQYDPASQELKRAAADMLDRIQAGELTPQDARSQIVELRESYDPQNTIQRASRLCGLIRQAFPADADALGCRPIQNEYDAETVINTVCSRLRNSVPTVSPEQFNCPKSA